MKVLILALVTLMSLAAFSDSDKGRKDDSKDDKRELKGHPKPLSVFDVIPLNSPVKESVARFLIKTPDRFAIDEVAYQVKNSGRIFERPRAYQKITLINGAEGKELRINVSKLPPGFYQILVKIKDRSRKEHHFKTKYKDHAMFVIDSSLQVPMPDPIKNNATLLGIDSDNDGIRDDVQRWINENLSNETLELKLAFKQYAIFVQKRIENSANKVNSIIASHEQVKSTNCAIRVGQSLNISLKTIQENTEKIDFMYLNTEQRIKASINASANFHGQEVILVEKELACNF